MIPIEATIHLNRFQPRSYQIPLIDAVENKGYKRVMAILPRRAGKDIACWNLMIRQALRLVGVYFYIFPTYAQAKKVIWDSVTNDGIRFLDFIPKQLILSTNSQEMKIRFTNGSLIQLVGSDNIDSLVGTNARGIVYSEYALQDPRAYQLLRPVLTANNGWAVFISTPRGKNNLWDLWNIAINNPEDWFAYKLTVEDTQHIDLEDIDRERQSGEMSEDLIQQEYYTSFEMGVEGAYYTKYLDRMRVKGQIGIVPWEPAFPVHTAWDIGVRDSTTIIFFQTIGQTVRIIDYYEKNKEGLEHYAAVLQNKDYTYGKHIAPHDISVREWGSGITRIEKARQLGVKFITAPDVGIADGIEAVRSLLSKVWIDERNCSLLINALENYRQEYDAKKKVYKANPLHNFASHACFDGETLVKMQCEDKKIKDIKVGDFVVTPLGFKKVLAVHKRMASYLCDISVGNKIITCTPEHNIFTNSGLINSGALRYSHVMENYSFMKGFIWKKIFGYFFEVDDIKGFKKTISFLKMKKSSSLMASFIDSMMDTIEEEEVHTIHYPTYIEQFLNSTTEKLNLEWRFITSMVINRIMIYPIYNCSVQENIKNSMLHCQDLGQRNKNAKTCSDLSLKKQRNGIEVMKDVNGTENMQKEVCHAQPEKNIIKYVSSVLMRIRQCMPGKNIAPINVKQKLASLIKKISFFVIASYVRLNSFVINTLLKRHAVKNVQLYQCEIPREVYDLTIEDDNCYYANGYLVSNCDAMRYMAVSLPKTKDGISSEERDRLYRQAMYGEVANMPAIFREDLP